MAFSELLSMLVSFAFGLGFVVLLLGFMYYRNAHRWRDLASVYGRSWEKPMEQKRFQHGVLYGKNVAFNSYNGILTIGLHETGFALKLLGPLVLFSPPLFIPYNDIEGWGQNWYLNAKSVELKFARTPELKMVMPKSQVEWMQERAGVSIDLKEEMSPHNDMPVFWYALCLGLGLCSCFLIGYLIFGGVSP